MELGLWSEHGENMEMERLVRVAVDRAVCFLFLNGKTCLEASVKGSVGVSLR
jgi:hypothetical protein